MIAISIGFLVLIWPLVFAVCIVLNCKPISFAWDKTIPNGHCLDLAVIYFSLSGISTFIDVILLLLPIPWLWGLQMNRQKKLSLIAAFILGGFVCIAGIVRLVFINKLVYQDITWTLTETSVWINVECSIGIFCACLPSLRPLIRRILPGSKQSTNTARSRNPRSSLRLPDHESTLNRGTIISTKPFDGAMPPLPFPDENDGSGASRRHRTWYSSVVPARTGSGEGESMEEMVPIRKADSKVDASV